MKKTFFTERELNKKCPHSYEILCFPESLRLQNVAWQFDLVYHLIEDEPCYNAKFIGCVNYQHVYDLEFECRITPEKPIYKVTRLFDRISESSVSLQG